MSIDPDLRIALGFMLLLRAGIGIIYSWILDGQGILGEIRRLPGAAWRRWFVLACLAGPLILFVIDAGSFAWVLWEISPDLAGYSIMRLPALFRWLMLAPAVLGLLLAIWSRHCATSSFDRSATETSANRLLNGPFRFVRFPQSLADLTLFGSLLLAVDNWCAVLAFVVACSFVSGIGVPHAEEAWRRLLGEAYGEYADRTGAILPRMQNRRLGMAEHYAVPKRFGLSAIIALVTMFALIFGGINLLQTKVTEFKLSRLSPVVHLFLGVELLTIWICQMRFGQSPRRVSALVGALLLPVFVFMSINAPSSIRALVMFGLFFTGGLIGYCLGALAAGLFLVMDWCGPILLGSRKRHASNGSAAASVTSPWADEDDRP